MSDVVLSLRGVKRGFGQGENRLEILRGCDLAVARGQRIALIGPSGSGKSTLLHIAGLLERADEGDVEIAGVRADKADDATRTALRRQSLGFVYQFHHLLPEFSALENVMLPQMLAGSTRGAAEKRAKALLDKVGLAARITHRPAELSGGEQQRVALARALANRPALLIADEPTGNLDPHTSESVFAMLEDVVRDESVGLLMATHNLALAARMDGAVTLCGGLIVPYA